MFRGCASFWGGEGLGIRVQGFFVFRVYGLGFRGFSGFRD